MLFSVALIFIDQWLKGHPNLKAQCPFEICFVQFDQKIIKNIKKTTLEPISLVHFLQSILKQNNTIFHVPCKIIL